MKVICKGCLREVEVPEPRLVAGASCPYCRTLLERPDPRKPGKRMAYVPPKDARIASSADAARVQDHPDREQTHPTVDQSDSRTGHASNLNVQSSPAASQFSTSQPSGTVRAEHSVQVPEFLVFTCPVCGKKYRLPSARVPRGRQFRLNCKSCGTARVTDFEELLRDTVGQDIAPVKTEMPATPPPKPAKTKGPAYSEAYLRKKAAEAAKADGTVDLRADVQRPAVYHIRTSDGEFGPMNLSESRKWCDQGFLKKDDLVRKDAGDFKPAWHFPELRPNLKDYDDVAEDPDSGSVSEISSVKEITNVPLDDWSFWKLIRGVGSGMIGGAVFSPLPIVLSFLKGIPLFRAVIAPRDDMSIFGGILVQLLFWTILGGFQGSLLSVLEAFALFRHDSADLWKVRHFWTGLLTGAIAALFLFILEAMDMTQIPIFTVYFGLMTLLLLLAHQRFPALGEKDTERQ